MSIALSEPTVATSSPAGAAARASGVSRHAPSRRYKTLAVLLWTLALLIGGELAVRGRAWYRHGSATTQASIYEPDELLGRRLIPGATIAGSCRHLTVNQWGFRGADVPRTKPAGTVRFAVLGDSTSFGLEASTDAAVWPAQLCTQLLADLPNRHFDVLNGAVPGYTLESSERQLRARLAPFDPDVVIIQQVSTDIAAHARRQFPPAPATTGAASNTGSYASRFLQEHSLLLNLVRVNATIFSARLEPAQRHDRLDDRGVREYADRLTAFVKQGQARGYRVVLCTCPRAFGDPDAPTDQHVLAASALAHNPALTLAGLNDAYDRYNDAVRAVADQTGACLADLAREVPRRGTYFADAIHPNDAGHALIGAVVARAVEACGLPPVATPATAGAPDGL